MRAAGTVDEKPVRHAAAATRLATVALSVSTRTGRSTITSADRPSRPSSSSRPASSKQGSRVQRPLPPLAPQPALPAAVPAAQSPPHRLPPPAHPPPAPRHPPPWTAHRANTLTEHVGLGGNHQPLTHKQHDCLQGPAGILS